MKASPKHNILRTLLSLIIVFFLQESKAQGWIYSDPPSGSPARVVECNDNNILFVGLSGSITRIGLLNQNGERIWSLNYEGMAASPTGFDGIQLENGNFIILGSNGERTDGIKKESFIIQLDPDGNILEEEYFGGNYSTDALDLALMPDGGYIATIYRESILPNDTNHTLLRRFTATGELLWEHPFNHSAVRYTLVVKNDGEIAFLSEEGQLVRINSEGIELDSFFIGEGDPSSMTSLPDKI